MNDLAPLIASAAIACFMLLTLIALIIYAISADTWIRATMRRRGMVKISRSQLKEQRKKKKEVRQRLLNDSMKSQTTQNTIILPATTSFYGTSPTYGGTRMEKTSMVHGWSPEQVKTYEEKGYTVELEDEAEDEYKIETSVVDNEVLDVGPFKNMGASNSDAIDGNVYSKPYIYNSNVHKSSPTTGIVSNMSEPEDVLDTSNFSIDDKVIRM